MILPAPFSRYRALLERELKDAVGDSLLSLYGMLRYHLGWEDPQGQPQPTSGGKMLRPTLCLLACEAVGGDWHHALPAAAAVELVHNFSLIHDDIEDVSSQRRHRPTIWWLWGQAQGINAGDTMHALAQLALLRLEEQGVPCGKVLQALRLLDQTCVWLCEGQYLDISFEKRRDVDMVAYQEMAERKTAQLFETSLRLGALIGTDRPQPVEQLGALGRKLGLAYQMWDDLQGIWGEEELTGKSPGDIQQKKKTPPVVYALGKASPWDRERLLRLYSQESLSPEDIVQVRDILERQDARGYTERMLAQYYQEALSLIDMAELSPAAQRELREVAGFILQREQRGGM